MALFSSVILTVGLRSMSTVATGALMAAAVEATGANRGFRVMKKETEAVKRWWRKRERWELVDSGLFVLCLSFVRVFSLLALNFYCRYRE